MWRPSISNCVWSTLLLSIFIQQSLAQRTPTISYRRENNAILPTGEFCVYFLEPPKPKTQSPLQMECFHSVLIRVLFWCAYCLWVSHPFPGRGRANLGAQPTGSSSLPQARFIMPLGKLSRAASIRTDPPPPSFFSKATTFFPFVFFVFSNRLILDYFPNRRHKKKCCKY